MTAALLMAAQVAQGPQGSVHHGRQGSVDVPIPRLEGTIAVDGVLDEAAWARAALLTGFSQYMPVDGAPAVDSTDVLVWYDADGIYFGIQAHEPHGIVNATLADRDRIDNDDYVQILLDAFNDRRRALVIGVNPLGVQADGIRSEGSPGAAAGRSTSGRFENVDMNPDFTYTSKGRLTAFGYEVEVFIPFKSLRFQATDPQDWALNVIRKVQHSGYENTWTPVRRANASFLAQSGTLQGLTGLSRGLVLDLNPFATLRADGGPASGEWEYDTTPEIGANGRWGITNNLTLDATINPDFAQVEADVGAITINERFAVFFPERRPFFLEGIEQFDTPNTLIYTRRIIEPVGGAKLTGKIGPINIGALSSVEDKSHSSTGDDYPLFNLFRIRGDLGENSTAGLVYTDKIDGDNYNRVIGGDARIVFAKLYYIEAQLVGAFTKTDGTSRFGPLWEVLADRTGRHWGFHYSVKGISSDFEAQSGFVNRTGVVEPTIFNRITTYGQPGAFLENYTTFIGLTGVWDYDGFFEFAAPLETSVSANNRFTLRGGWAPSITPSWSTAAFDPAFYADYYVETTSGGITDTVSFAVPDRVNDAYAVSVGIGTPQFPVFSMSADASAGKSVAYFEPSRANTLGFSTTLTVRPTNQLRIEARYAFSRLARERDGTQLSVAHIPRLKIEYQIARPLFVRFVGQYASQAQDALRDPRTDEPILITDPETGIPTAAEARTINDFRLDLLLSFRPTPGTVVFLGYGASLTEPNRFRFTDLERTQDGFFAKVSYLFRM
jgi:hypothetical protein